MGPSLMGGVFRYSVWDAINVAVIPLQAAFFVWLAPMPVVYVPALLNSGGGANHNHYHTPFFRPRWLNAAAHGLLADGCAQDAVQPVPHHHATKKSWNDESFLQIVGLRRPLFKQVLAFLAFYLESFGLKYVVLFVLLKRWPVERFAAFATPNDQVMSVRCSSASRNRTPCTPPNWMLQCGSAADRSTHGAVHALQSACRCSIRPLPRSWRRSAMRAWPWWTRLSRPHRPEVLAVLRSTNRTSKRMAAAARPSRFVKKDISP